METHDPGKDTLKQPGEPGQGQSQELEEDDLKAITGGLSSAGTASGGDVCVSLV